MGLPKKSRVFHRGHDKTVTNVRDNGGGVPAPLAEQTDALWTCLHFPRLPLEIYTRGAIRYTPLAISTGTGTRERVLACNHAALACGVQPDMTVPAAYALAGGLHVFVRNEIAERAALARIAAWAGQFTSMVSLAPPAGLVLEVSGSLALHGGLAPLLARLKQGAETLGYESRIATAPTPLAATWLARANCEAPVTDLRSLRAQLASLPLRALGLDAKTLETLTALGLRCIGDCLRLPRAGLSRRFGPALLRALDRALGKAPDARQIFVPPPCFNSRLLLPASADNGEALLFAAGRLLHELAGFLEARAGGIQEFSLELRPVNAAPTRVELRLLRPSRNVHYLRELLKVRLETVALRAPVEEIRLRASKILALPARDQDLFDSVSKEAITWLAGQSVPPDSEHQLIERLRARLGDDAVRGLCLVPEHRPERTYRRCAPGDPGPRLAFENRPLWLLVTPFPLRTVQGHPWLQGELVLRAGPERIESGWWDRQDIARDYFVAENANGSRFWIFREHRKRRRWFLHGLFA